MIRVVGPKDPRVKDAINTTSSSINWSRGLSPFFLGPVDLYDGYWATNVENGWQYSKVYERHTDIWSLDPTDDYWHWAKKGWNNPEAVHYPMGKGAVPLYSYWKYNRLGYIDARKEIYIPLYTQAVIKTEAYQKLKSIYKEQGSITLFDFDGWDYLKLGMSLEDVLNDPTRKMGHAFVLAMLLTE